MQNNYIKKDSHKHEFAFYYQEISSHVHQSGVISLVSEELCHRLKHVVRAQVGQKIILFNQDIHASFLIASFLGKNQILGSFSHIQCNKVITPAVTFILPLLKIDALSDAVYALAEVGVTRIQLVSTDKTQTTCTPKLLEKLQRVIFSAAEQSKNFSFPTLISPCKLSDYIPTLKSGKKFHFDMQGQPFVSWYKPMQDQDNYYLLIGPEGDLTGEEQQLVFQAGFEFCALTSTVLRSVRAVSIISALFRL